ncbi:MAG: (Fe-S)-binding protein [Chloroflexi bacterium RBG_16_60_22]|nr:MAG: (Fe-S)-binding protein [Chloroflexi bacterium RBG_16_60_22]
MAVSKRIVLHFPPRLVNRPIVYRLVKDYDLEFNILKASISPEEEGLLVLELRGNRQEYEKGIEFLARTGIKVQPLSQDITRDEDRCTHCGACVTICPAGAFVLNPATRVVSFDNEKCIACGICIAACPPRAMKVQF